MAFSVETDLQQLLDRLTCRLAIGLRGASRFGGMLMSMQRWWLAGAMATTTLVAAFGAQADCKFQKIAEVPVTMDGLRPLVTASVNGHDATFLVSTGSFFSSVSPEAAERFGMRKSTAPFGLEVTGLGGVSRDAHAVMADSFIFANAGLKNIQFLVAGGSGGGRAAGGLGQNIMGPFDVEYDFAHGVMRFFKAAGCGGANLAYWASGITASRLSLDSSGIYMQEVLATAQINGHTVKVKFNSGAGVSYLDKLAAERAGIQINAPVVSSAGVTQGAYGKGIETFVAPFDSFKIGEEEIKNTQLRVAKFGENGQHGDMLLGADFFLSHRILISSSQKKLYFTYNGGPVFRLDRAATGQTQVASGSAPPASGTPATATPIATPPPAQIAGEEPKTAADFARRGAAFAARHEYQSAIDDYGRALQLEPDNGPAYRARAMARLSARQPILAMADLDEALKRQPNDPEALMNRGELYLSARDPDRAKNDFATAMKLAPDNADLPAQAGGAYSRAGLYEQAIQQLDIWIAAHPKSDSLASVLSSRCYARAAWGKELDAALADCDAAMRKDKTSVVMQRRGLVLLRQGRLDDAIVQYSAAIKAQPRFAMALYGRGVAELKKGDKPAGDADIAAAVAIAPGLPAEFKRLGLPPDADSKVAGA
jgi:tetratricopeptide (TPR) repeat protein/predicted aspartyl protease